MYAGLGAMTFSPCVGSSKVRANCVGPSWLTLRLPPADERGASRRLQVILGPGGSATAFAGVLVTWLKTRQTVFSASIETPGGKVALKSRNVDDPDELMANIAKLLQSPAGADAS